MQKIDFEVKFDAKDAGSFTGLASTYDGDAMGDMVARGAFAQSLATFQAKGRTPPLLWQHDPASPIGTIVGLEETDQGLAIKGQIILDTDDGRKAHALMKSGAVTGLSIGFIATDFERRGRGRLLKSIDLKEISVVTFPMNDGARVTAVKTAPVGAQAKESSMLEDEGQPAPEADNDVERLTAELKAMSDKVAKLEAKANRPSVPAEAKAQDAEKKGFIEWARTGNTNAIYDQKSLTIDGGTAGALVPEEMVREIIKDLVQMSPVRSVARVGTMNTGTILLPKRTGRISGQWVGETGARPKTQPAYNQDTVTAFEYAAEVEVSNGALEDAGFDIEAELRMGFAESFAEAEGSAFVTGTGAGQPTGFTTDANVGQVNAAATTDFTGDELIDLYHAIKAPYRANAVWGMSNQSIATARKLKTADGHYLLNMAGINGAPTTTILGRPVVEMVDLPDPAATESPIWFGDFSRFYRIFDRIVLQVLRDPYSQASNGLVVFHGRHRVAGGPVQSEAAAKLTMAAA